MRLTRALLANLAVLALCTPGSLSLSFVSPPLLLTALSFYRYSVIYSHQSCTLSSNRQLDHQTPPGSVLSPVQARRSHDAALWLDGACSVLFWRLPHSRSELPQSGISSPAAVSFLLSPCVSAAHQLARVCRLLTFRPVLNQYEARRSITIIPWSPPADPWLSFCPQWTFLRRRLLALRPPPIVQPLTPRAGQAHLYRSRRPPLPPRLLRPSRPL